MSYGIRTLSQLLPMILAFAALLELAAAGRELPAGPGKSDKKQPEWLLDPDGSFLIPGIGRVMLPPKYRAHLPNMPYLGGGGSGMNLPGGGGGGVMSPPAGGSYVPGGDDTFVPNPGVEVPNPSRGSIPAPSSPWRRLINQQCRSWSRRMNHQLDD